MINAFKPETYPAGIAYMRDTAANRDSLTANGFFGGEFHLGNTAYIEVYLNSKKWFGTPDFQWLYRNSPPIKTIEEIKELYSNWTHNPELEVEIVLAAAMDENNAYVTRDGIRVKEFNRFAEDYAFDLAKKYRTELMIKLKNEGYTNVRIK